MRIRFVLAALLVASIPLLVSGFLAYSSEAKDTVSQDGLTVSHDASNDPPFEWTLERMLLAVPMPMTQEGRKFLTTHPSLENVREWNAAQFDKYLDSDYALQHVAEESVRWRDLAHMLEGQIERGSKFLQKEPPSTSKPPCFPNADSVTIDDLRKMLSSKEERAAALAQMKIWREQIADLAPQVEALRKEASDKGQADLLEKVMTPD